MFGVKYSLGHLRQTGLRHLVERSGGVENRQQRASGHALSDFIGSEKVAELIQRRKRMGPMAEP